jgi:hypothetical protein
VREERRREEEKHQKTLIHQVQLGDQMQGPVKVEREEEKVTGETANDFVPRHQLKFGR